MKTNLIGLDIGGTKCSVILGSEEGDGVEVRDKVKFATTTVDRTLSSLMSAVSVDGNVDFPQIVIEKGATKIGIQR